MRKNRNTNRYINLKDFDPYDCLVYGEKCTIESIMSTLDRIPTAKVKPIEYAVWIYNEEKQNRFCSKCGMVEPYKSSSIDNVTNAAYNYCPYCGAKIRN